MAVNEAYIKELTTDRQGVFQKLHTQIKENRLLRYGEHEIPIPEAYKSTTQVVRSPIVADILFRVVATLTTDDPVVSVPPFSQTDKAKRNSSLRERWTQAALTRMMREAERDVFRMMIDGAAADGLGIGKLVDRLDVWTGFPRRRPEEQFDINQSEDENKRRANSYLGRTEKFVKGKGFPFFWTDIDALSYYPLRGNYGELAEVLEITERAAVPAMKAFGVRRARGKAGFEKRKPGETLSDDSDYGGQKWSLTEHWEGGDTVSYMLDNEIVEQRSVNYPRPPYFPVGGHTTSSRDPHRMYQSVIQPFAHLIPTLDSVLTMTSNWVYLSAYPFLRLIDPDGRMTLGPEDPTSVTDLKAGDVLRNVEFIEAPSVAKGIADMVNLLNMMIDRSGLAAVMYGQGASSSSGYMVAQLMTAAQLVYAPIIDNARMAMEQIIPFLWQLVERRIRRKVFVWGGGTAPGAGDWLGLGPDDIDGYYACDVNLKPLLPMDEIAQGDFAARMQEKKLWSRRRAMERAGVEQPDAEQDEIFGEEAIEAPPIKQKLIEDAAREQGLLPKPEPAPPMPQGPGLVDQFGQPMGGPPMGGANLGGFGPTPPMEPPGPLMPGQGLPMVPPPPVGAGMPPQGIQRRPGGNFGPPPGSVV